jgi:hypothetical protein
MSNFHPAVKLLLARMESNPEEFVGGYRWTTMLNTVREHEGKEEKEAINRVFKALQLDAAHEKIMKELLCEGSSVQTTYPATALTPHPPLGQVINNLQNNIPSNTYTWTTFPETGVKSETDIAANTTKTLLTKHLGGIQRKP